MIFAFLLFYFFNYLFRYFGLIYATFYIVLLFVVGFLFLFYFSDNSYFYTSKNKIKIYIFLKKFVNNFNFFIENQMLLNLLINKITIKRDILVKMNSQWVWKI